MNNKIETLSELKTKWRLEKYSSLFIIYSFIGWIIEVTWILFFFKKFVILIIYVQNKRRQEGSLCSMR